MPFEAGGVAYWLRPATWGMLGLLESLFAGDMLAKVERTRGQSGSIAYRTRLEAAVKLIEQGEYSEGDKGYRKQLRTGKGFARLCWMMLRDSPPHPDLARVEQLVRDYTLELSVRVKLLNRPGKERQSGKAVPFETLAAVLATEPCLLPLSAIADLTPYQTSDVYGHPRDEHGQIRMPADSELDSSEGKLRALTLCLVPAWRAQGLSEEEIGRRWEVWFDRVAGVESAK